MDIQVVNLKTHKRTPFDHYIGRGNSSKLGNPFTSIGDRPTLAGTVVPNRQQSIDEFKIYLQAQLERKNPEIIKELNKIKTQLITQGKVNLVCFCAPKPCHGNVIKDLIIQTIKQEVAQKVETKKAAGLWVEPGLEPSAFQLKEGSQVTILDERGRELEALVTRNGFVVKGQPFKEGVLLVGPPKGVEEVKHIVRTVIHNRDHAVVLDRGQEPDQEPVELIVAVKEIGGRKVLFQGSTQECTRWHKATDAERLMIEKTADETFKRKLGVNAVKQFDIAAPGKQSSLGL